MQAITNARIVMEDRIIENGTVYYDNRILKIEQGEKTVLTDKVINAEGKLLLPGLIDIHSHGRCGHHVLDGEDEELLAYADALCQCGVTRFLPTTMTRSTEQIQRMLDSIRRNIGKGAAVILGANLEGPYLNPEYRGAHEEQYLKRPDAGFVEKNADVIKIVTMAPEMDTDGDFISRVRQKGIVISVGHSGASYEQAVQALADGAGSFTHLFNAMGGFHHMRPGMAGAALLMDSAYVELIGDMEHIKPAVYPLIIRCKPLNRILLITDCQTVGGMKPGKYETGGIVLQVDERIAKLENGIIAGSVISENMAIRNFYQNTNLTLPQVVRMASLNQAELLKLDKDLGSIAVGKYADFALFDDDFNAEITIVEGVTRYEREYSKTES